MYRTLPYFALLVVVVMLLLTSGKKRSGEPTPVSTPSVIITEPHPIYQFICKERETSEGILHDCLRVVVTATPNSTQ